MDKISLIYIDEQVPREVKEKCFLFVRYMDELTLYISTQDKVMAAFQHARQSGQSIEAITLFIIDSFH